MSRRAIAGLAPVAAPPAAGRDFGWNFRKTAGFVTDADTDVFGNLSQGYPQSYQNANLLERTGGLVDFGTGPPSFEADYSSLDARTSGTAAKSGGPIHFSIDRPAGTRLRVWIGAAALGSGVNFGSRVTLYDGINTSVVINAFAGSGLFSTNQIADIYGNVTDEATWLANYDTAFYDMPGPLVDTALTIEIDRDSQDWSAICHIGILDL